MDPITLRRTRRKSIYPRSRPITMDPAVWSGLDAFALDLILSKVPFSCLVKFRLVCKDWCFVKIPQLMIQFQVLSGQSLLYFGRDEVDGSARWRQIHKEKREYGELATLSGSFPSPGKGEKAVLMACEGGLLFFAFSLMPTGKVRAILSCNPITSKYKLLVLPSPLLPLDELTECPSKLPCGKILVGVLIDQTTKNYTLVVSGIDEDDRSWTYLYYSTTCTWKTIDGSPAKSLIPYLRWAYSKPPKFSTGRSVCVNGSLYWSGSISYCLNCVLRFCLQSEEWTVVSKQLFHRGTVDPNRLHITAHKGKVLMWHTRPSRVYYDCVESYAHDPMEYDINDPEVMMMPQHMINGLTKCMSECLRRAGGIMRNQSERFFRRDGHYCGFSDGHLFYHTMISTKKQSLKIIVHDPQDNRYTLLPEVKSKHLICREEPTECLWIYTGSFMSAP